MIVSHGLFIAIATAIVVGTCVGYIITHAVRIHLVLAGKMGDEHDRHDRLFGAIMGTIIMLIGLAGVVKYYWY